MRRVVLRSAATATVLKVANRGFVARSLTIKALRRGCDMGPLACRNLCFCTVLW